MTYENQEFEDVDRFDGQIRGELANGEGVVTTPDKNWDETNEDDLEGNWEEITSTILSEAMNSSDQRQTNRLSLEKERVVNIISDSDIIRAEHETESWLQASLLLEYLVSKGVYKRNGDEVVILEEFDVESDLETKLNWCAFLSTTRKKIENSIEIAEDRAEKVADMISTVETTRPETKESTEELLEDLARVTGNEHKPRGYDEYGLPIPPKGVDDEHKHEYQELIVKLDAKDTVKPGNNPETPDDARKRLNVKVAQLRQYVEEFQKGEAELREKSIIDIADIEGVMETLNNSMRIAPVMFNGNPIGEEDPREVAQGIDQLAAEHGVDLTPSDEEIEEESSGLTEDGFVDEEAEEAVSDDAASTSPDVLFDDEAQND